MSKKTTIHLGDEALAVIGAVENEGYSFRVNGILTRYARMVAEAMPEFTVPEWSAILDANNGMGGFEGSGFPDASTSLWPNVADSVPDGLNEKWGVDCLDIARRMRDIPYSGQVAMYEIVRGFWASPDINKLPVDDLIKKLGAKITP